MSMKFVPFTTRPLSTSRHGITRLSSTAPLPLFEQRLRLRDAEAPLVERLAGDHARKVHEAQVAQGGEVLGRRNPARVEEAAAEHVRHVAHLVEVRAGQ